MDHPKTCWRCDGPGYYDPDAERAVEALQTYTPDGGGTLVDMHPSCYQEMLTVEGCGGGD
jgi:hypothetical protein